MPDLQSQSSQQTQSGQLQETHPEKEQVLTYAEAHPVDEIIRKLSHHAEELHPKTDRDEAETAPELIHDYDVKCELAEERMRELYHAEKEIKQRVHDIEQDQAREILEFEMKMRDMNAKIEIAQHNLDELKLCYEQDRDDLDKKQDHLHKLHAQARILQALEEKHKKESAELKIYVEQLNKKAEKEHENAKKLLDEYQRIQIEIVSQIQQLAQEEAALEEDEYIVSKRKEQRSFIECCGKEQLEEEALACQKAEELELKIKEELREAQKDVSEQHAAKERAVELSKSKKRNA